MVVCLAVGRTKGLFHLLEAPGSFHPVLEWAEGERECERKTENNKRKSESRNEAAEQVCYCSLMFLALSGGFWAGVVRSARRVGQGSGACPKNRLSSGSRSECPSCSRRPGRL